LAEVACSIKKKGRGSLEQNRTANTFNLGTRGDISRASIVADNS
jgi:hypothetical protein